MQNHYTREQEDYWEQIKYSWDLKGLDDAKGVYIASLNIRSGRVGGLEVALLTLQQGNIYFGVLQETKLIQRITARYGSGYTVLATEAESRHQGGWVIVVYREEEGCQVVGIAEFAPNMVSFLLKIGSW